MAKIERQESRLRAAASERAELVRRIDELEVEAARLRGVLAGAEVTALEAALVRAAAPGASPGAQALARRAVLFVGGRLGSIEQIRNWVASRGGVLLVHDGRVEQSLATLPGLVSRADAVCFPVDCVSHSAVNVIKKACRDLARTMIPLRSAGLGSFAATLDERAEDRAFEAAAG